MSDAAVRNRYLVLRHGHSRANELGLIVSDPVRGVGAFGLTDQGRVQVRETVTAARERGELDADTRIVTSPFLRAVQSAAAAAEIVGARPITRDARLRERGFGRLELDRDTCYEQVWARDRRDPTHTQWGVEAVTAEVARLRALIADLERGGGEGVVLLVTHGDIASALCCWAGGRDLREHRAAAALSPAGLQALTWAPGDVVI